MKEERDRVQQVIDSVMAGKQGPVILEAGCGSLSHLRFAPDSHVVGIDIDQGQLERNQGLHERILGDIQSYELPESRFDAIVCWDVLEHVEKPAAALREAWRVLVPGGLLIVLIPNDGLFRFARYVFLRFKEARRDYGHVSEWDPGSTREGVESAGFEIVGARNLPGPFWATSLHHLCIGKKP